MSNAEYESTVALTMIIKDEFAKVESIIHSDDAKVFDQMVFVISDKPTYDRLMQHPDAAEFYYRPWNDRFDEARNFALSKVRTNYWFWIDADDSFDFKYIPVLVKAADDNGFDEIMLPYVYAQNENGQVIAQHWRERLLRTSHPFYWKGWVHETPLSDVPFKAHRLDIPVYHNNSDEHTQESLLRNHEILLKAVQESDDPRYKMYLGQSFASQKKYLEAIAILDKFVEISGNIEDVYRVLCTLSECAYHLKKHNRALLYAAQASMQIPEYPQAYRLMAQWEESQNNWEEALEWAKVADGKPEPDGMGIYNPAGRDDVRLIAMHCEFMLGHYRKALAWLNKLPANHPAREEFEEDLRDEANAELFIEMLPKQRKYFSSDEALYNSLAEDLKYDARLQGLRSLVVPPKTWSDKSIVILCGQGYENWSAETLHKGMGGSEEAVVYIARELTKLGWDVTIYGAVDSAEFDVASASSPTLVKYLPWKHINKDDKFNVFVAWRAPDFLNHIDAKVKLADIHDLIPKQMVEPRDDATYLFKSQYHKNQYDDVDSRVIGNGIVKEQFK